ncbi:hypothetical protein HD554DRAFT_2149383 [Boletus coccyginus]|nr:hypothetical protein HD554DRAFT_2149383 [Boletus coccyginus]
MTGQEPQSTGSSHRMEGSHRDTVESHNIRANEGPSSSLASKQSQGDTSNPPTDRLANLYIKRSKAAEKMQQWDLALEDANRAIELDPRSPLAYERKEAVQSTKTKYDLSVFRARS